MVKRKLAFKWVIITLFFIMFIFTYIRQRFIMDGIQRKITESQEQLNQINDKNHKLQDQLKKADSDEYVEKLVRERLGMVKDGEKVLNITKQN